MQIQDLKLNRVCPAAEQSISHTSRYWETECVERVCEKQEMSDGAGTASLGKNWARKNSETNVGWGLK